MYKKYIINIVYMLFIMYKIYITNTLYNLFIMNTKNAVSPVLARVDGVLTI